MKYIYLFGALLMAAVVGGLTQQMMAPMIAAGPPEGILHYAARIADANTHSGASFGGEFELMFFTALPWILPAAWVIWIFLRFKSGNKDND